MGCDIHFQVERPTADGWEAIKPAPGLRGTFPNETFPVGKWRLMDNTVHEGDYEDSPVSWETNPRGRDYRLFARLAGVRNQCVYTPLFAGRGIPDDADLPSGIPLWRDGPALDIGCHEDPRSIDSHSPGYALVGELLGHFDNTNFGTWIAELAEHYGPDHRVLWWFDN